MTRRHQAMLFTAAAAGVLSIFSVSDKGVQPVSLSQPKPNVVNDTINKATTPVPTVAPDFASMTKAELLHLAQNTGVKVFKSWTKERIVEALNAPMKQAA